MVIQKPNPQSLSPQGQHLPQKPPALQSVKVNFDNFLDSLGDVLMDITALEVNTMVVSNITGNKFNAEVAYEKIFNLPSDAADLRWEEEKFAEIHPQLRQKYCDLRKKLTQEYILCLHNQGIFDPTQEVLPPLLSPDVQRAFNDPQFLRSLRKVSELRAALDSDDLKSPRTDMIFAQTVIQLDGDVINRYHQALFEHPQKQTILDIHNQGVTCGEKQWHGLLGFMVNLIQDILSSTNANRIFKK